MKCRNTTKWMGRSQVQASRVVDFGMLTDREWVDFQMTPEFTATMKQKYRAALNSPSRNYGIHTIKRGTGNETSDC